MSAIDVEDIEIAPSKDMWAHIAAILMVNIEERTVLKVGSNHVDSKLPCRRLRGRYQINRGPDVLDSGSHLYSATDAEDLVHVVMLS
jgi:hypothetical protein